MKLLVSFFVTFGLFIYLPEWSAGDRPKPSLYQEYAVKSTPVKKVKKTASPKKQPQQAPMKAVAPSPPIPQPSPTHHSKPHSGLSVVVGIH